MDYDAVLLRLSELQAQIRAKIRLHSQLLKDADKANWDKSAIDRSTAVLAEIRSLEQELNELLALVEGQLAKDGYELPVEPKPTLDEPARWWKKDLGKEEVPILGWIEDSLHAGLELLIDRLSPGWWKTQQELREAAGYESLRELVALYGGVSGNSSAPRVHRYAYALMLARDLMEKYERYDIYEGALLVPFVGALCTLLAPLREVKGGYEKLDQLSRAPSEEVDSRLYEIIVAARCASLGREVEFLNPGTEPTPDLRIHDFGFPAVVECKMQSRLSNRERLEFETMQRVFRALTVGREQRGLIGTLTITSNRPLEEVGEPALVEASVRCTRGINPYQTVEEDWGVVSFAPLEPSLNLTGPTRIYSPEFLEQVFDWNSENAQYDGICAIVKNNQAMTTGRAELPFCLKWAVEHEGALSRKARLLASNLSEAFNQIPVGEAGLVYLAYEETHRAPVADHRTQRFMDMVAGWEVRKRGINPQLIVLNRLYPGALHDGRPDLIESAIPSGFTGENVWAGTMPMMVFVNSAA
jgi:hypothetical protein